MSLNDYFEELITEGVTFAALIIREEFGLTTCYDDLDEVFLPPHLRKHRCYAIWCWKRGWKVSKKSKLLTIYKPTPEFDTRPNVLSAGEEDPMWPEESKRKEVCSWPTLLFFVKNTNQKSMFVQRAPTSAQIV